MDQWLVGALALVVFVVVITAYEVGRAERKSRKAEAIDVHSGPDDVEKRARRAF